MSVSHPTAIKVLERDGYTCVRCRKPYHHIHHRKPKRMGGTSKPEIDQPPNLVCLCTNCHTLVHAEGPSMHGYLLRDGQDPEMTMILWRDRWVYLDGSGDILASSKANHPSQS